MFPGWLHSFQIWWMVKYGKSRFRILELALAFKFLSNADLVLQLHLLERGVSSYLDCYFWNIGLYLFGKSRYHMIVR
jgi:thiol:disulfide interchange protein DsbD